jgi:integrase
MLTAIAVQKATPKDRAYKLTDGRGLYLLVAPTGSKYWRYKYRHAGKEKVLALGTAREVSLADARDRRDEARLLLKSGVDPCAERQREKEQAKVEALQGAPFEAVAREWYEKNRNEWSERHAGYVLRRMESDLFPEFGAKAISTINAQDILAALYKIEARGAHEMARRARQYASNIFAYAIATQRANADPAASLTKALEKAPPEKHHAALKEGDLPEFYKRLAKYSGYPATPIAIRLLMLTAVRTSELLGARWTEFDLKKGVWRIPAERMKMKVEHIVPLSKQALALIESLRPISGDSELLFPSPLDATQPLCNNTILFALYRMGYKDKATGHGMRTLFSTTANENGFHADVIERQLAHGDPDKVRAAYNHAQWLPERRKLMAWWGEYLSGKSLAAAKKPK